RTGRPCSSIGVERSRSWLSSTWPARRAWIRCLRNAQCAISAPFAAFTIKCAPRAARKTAMMQHSPSDADARRQALDPMRSFIVQAPAGSGKTELLTQRYLRLLALVESPEQILAITFTRKAAAEMRSRVMRALAGAASPAPQSAHKRATWELARAVRAADARREWRLMDHPARLRIQTIDALNAQLARRLPVLAGLGAPLEPTEDPWPL